MNSDFISFPVNDFIQTKQQVLSWANQFNTCCFLDNHQYHFNHQRYECVAGVGALDFIACNAGGALSQLQVFQQKHTGWLFGHLGYDLKNETEDVYSALPDLIGFPDLFFFVPETVLLLNQNEICIATAEHGKAAAVHAALQNIKPAALVSQPAVHFQPRFSKQDYIATIEKLRDHILRGDCYEINFCQEFFAANTQIDPLQVYASLSAISPSPFAAFYKIDHRYLLCASPERYLAREGNTLISQPIKGTGKRDLSNLETDTSSRESLYASAKDRSENVMVVDLVRNDLSKVCIPGSVQVEELFGIYSFPQVHQMISTVSGILQPDMLFSEIIEKTFPMGSMTGAPKKKVLQLIEQYERTRRGIFSGAVGYIQPNGDFDLNVVIRSILYNQAAQYISYLVGSGITFNSKPAEEYEECLLKAAAIRKIFAP